jgi:hypothetical protein
VNLSIVYSIAGRCLSAIANRFAGVLYFILGISILTTPMPD